ncbi:hypothetical protein CKO23_20280 [Thiocystis violacea]|nr:hypothetical protein [Thiocystis violacea]
MLSAYFWFNRNKMPSEMREDDRITDFRDWLEEKTFAEDIDARMVFDRDKYLIDGEIALDYFIRYESLCDGMQFVCERVGVPWRAERLMYLKAGSRPCKIDRHLYYDSVATQKVIQWFDFEFEYFCYPREP